MPLLSDLISHIEQRELFRTGDPLLLAVSGGLDSVVMAHLFKRAGYDCIIAHCNFQLRGAESDRDERFVQDLAAQLHFPYRVQCFATTDHAATQKCSVQESARSLRYAWFRELAEQEAVHGKARLILTAHQADDNGETVLMHFTRGTGLAGLAGIPERSGLIRRPLLIFTRERLQQWAEQEGIAYVDDSSNASAKYTRNHFRLHVIPAIAEVFPAVKHNLLDNIDRFRETAALFEMLVEQLRKKTGKTKGDEWHVPAKQLLAFGNRALIYAFYSPFGFGEKQVDEIIKLASSNSGRYITSPDQRYRIIRHRHWLIAAPLQPEHAGHFIISAAGMTQQFSDLELHTVLKVATGKPPGGDAHEVQIDAARISFPLLLRKWKTGDYFYPLGMPKKKKLARFFIDQKLTKTEKEKVWVLESAGRIVWVIGHRIDDRMKITASTKQLLTIAVRQKRS